jgi:hypothetical protein
MSSGVEPTAAKHSRPPRDTQAGQILAMLLAAPAVCSTSFLAEYIPRAAAVIHKLRKQGYVISTRSCTRGHGHTHRQIEYRLEALPFNPKDPG